jgi:predicted MFS family arabinose efflux permease
MVADAVRPVARVPRNPLIARVWVVTGVVAVADFVFGATFVAFMQSHGLSGAVIGALLSITGITSVFLEAPSGAWGDRHGHKRLVVVGLALWGIGFVTFAFADATPVFALGILFWAAGLAIYSGAAVSLLINTLKSVGHEHQGETAVRGAETARWVAATIGAVIVAASAWALSMQMSIMASGLLLIGIAGWVLLRWPDSPSRSQSSVMRSLREGCAFLLAPSRRLLLVCTVLTSVDLAIVILTWQPLALQVVGLDAHFLGLALLVLSAAVAVGAISSRAAPWPPPVTACASLLLLNGCLALASVGAVGASSAVIGAEFFLGITLTTLAVWGQRLFPDRIRATTTSVLGTISGVAIAVTNASMGQLWDGLGLQRAITVVATAMIATTVVVATTSALASRRARTSPLEGRP